MNARFVLLNVKIVANTKSTQALINTLLRNKPLFLSNPGSNLRFVCFSVSKLSANATKSNERNESKIFSAGSLVQSDHQNQVSTHLSGAKKGQISRRFSTKLMPVFLKLVLNN
jgi:hypothetical protein